MLDDVVRVVRGVSWESFERRLKRKGERAVPRMHYLDGLLESVTPSRGHEGKERWLGALIATYAVEVGITLSSFGHWTLKDELRRAGAEPDDCYILGEDPDEKLTRPHFVIEVQWSSKGTWKLEIYKRLGVREVWFWENACIAVYVLHRGRWRKVLRSACLPDLDLELLASHLDRPAMTIAMTDFRAALRRRR
jgi:Uma2 family endonuclease